MIDEFVSLVNPVLFEPPFPPEGAAVSFRAAKDASGAGEGAYNKYNPLKKPTSKSIKPLLPLVGKPDLRNAHQERECPPRQPRWGRSSNYI